MRKVRVKWQQYVSESVCCPERKEQELPVYGNLAVTPAQMLDMAEKGIPISSQNIAMSVKDGEENPSWDLPLDQLRGVDPAAMWEHSQVIKERARKAHLNDVKRFGLGELTQRETKK